MKNTQTRITGQERINRLAAARQWRRDNKPYSDAIYGPETAAESAEGLIEVVDQLNHDEDRLFERVGKLVIVISIGVVIGAVVSGFYLAVTNLFGPGGLC